MFGRLGGLWAGSHDGARSIGLGGLGHLDGFVLQIVCAVGLLLVKDRRKQLLQHMLIASAGLYRVFLEAVQAKSLDGCAKAKHG